MMKFGFIQGRLSEPVDGKIQEFPKDWKQEYKTATHMGLNYIEWIVTQKTAQTNQIYGFEKRPDGPKILSLCADNIVKSTIFDEGALETELDTIISTANALNIPYVTIPFLEQSSLKGRNWREILNRMYKNSIYSKFMFTFELDLNLEELEKFVPICRRELGYVNLVYDTGNTQTMISDHTAYIEEFNRFFSHVHLKDRISGTYTTVEPGNGGVDFSSIINLLSKYNPDIVCMLQTARGETGKEQETILRHMNFFKKFGGFDA